MYRKSDIFAGNQTGEFQAFNTNASGRMRPATAHGTSSHPMISNTARDFGTGFGLEGGIAAGNNNQEDDGYQGQYQLPPRPSTANPSLGRGPSSALLYGKSKVELPVKLPRYVETDKQVARFWGHFYQLRPWERSGPLGDSRIEEEVGRKFVFYYYIYDNTIEIFEPRNINSGMPQGVFFRRGKLTNDETKADVELSDLAPGNLLKVLGREFTMTDADAFTRDYFQ